MRALDHLLSRFRLEEFAGEPTLVWLRWIAILLPLLFLVIFYVLMLWPVHTFLHTWPGFIFNMLLLAVAVTIFSYLVFGAIGRMHRTILLQNAELTRLNRQELAYNAQLHALNEAGIAITREREIGRILERVVEESRRLVNASYAAVLLLDESGRPQQFLVSSPAASGAASRLPPPAGQGVLARILRHGETIRTPDVQTHPAFRGFPQGHPAITSFLGVPILHQDTVIGNLYLGNKRDAPEFSAQDLEIARMFATQAAVAIENALLYEQVQAFAVEGERARIAREMHDGLAQVLGYVNTKAQAVREFLREGDIAAAQRQLDELVTAARATYADIREAILNLRVEVSEKEDFFHVLAQYIAEFSQHAGVDAVLQNELPEQPLPFTPTQEVQVLRAMLSPEYSDFGYLQVRRLPHPECHLCEG